VTDGLVELGLVDADDGLVAGRDEVRPVSARPRSRRRWRLADRPAAKARLKRSMFPIRAYVGPNGTGKSAIMVYDALLNLERGRPQLSTVRLLDYKDPRDCDGGPLCDDPVNHQREVMAYDLRPYNPDDPRSPMMRTSLGTGTFITHRQPHPLYVPLRDLRQILTWRDGDILADEVQGLFNSRESAGMPGPILTTLLQLRRANVSFSWSTPAWRRADKVLREVTQLCTLMTAALPARAPATADGLPRLWHRRRLFTARSYDPSCVDEFEAHRAMSEEVSPDIIAYYWGPGSTMFDAYDTMETVQAIGYSDSGFCVTCTGKRTAVTCSCTDYLEHKAASRVPRPRDGARS
jgi:hypothetical protein